MRTSTLNAGPPDTVIICGILWWPMQAFFAMTFIALRIASLMPDVY